MAFSDPIKVKVAAAEATCPRVSTGDFKSIYLSEDGLTKVTLSTQNGSRERHMARIDLSKITTDPFDSTQNIEVGASAYIVVDQPLAGFTNEELKKLVEGLTTFLTASEGSAIKKLIASES
jgi:hypothetical protein